MAKIVKITPEWVEELTRDFESAVGRMKLSDGRFSFTKSFASIKRCATVFFDKHAWDKMQGLIKGFSEEVAWHGVAYRGAEGTDEYYITDILVYPQEVTGGTVTTDQEKYQTWLMNHDDDVFNNIRMQGHSHVNMGVTPSSVDNALYDKILDQLEEDMFYIFMIYNKKGDKTFKIYDLAKNVLFETSDVTVKIIHEDTPEVIVDGVSDEEKKVMIDALNEHRTSAFVKSARDMVTRKQYSYSGTNYYPAKSGTTGYGTWQGSTKGTPPASTTPATKTVQQSNPVPQTPPSPPAAPSIATTTSTQKDAQPSGKKTRKGKRSPIHGLFDTRKDNFSTGFDPLKYKS